MVPQALRPASVGSFDDVLEEGRSFRLFPDWEALQFPASWGLLGPVEEGFLEEKYLAEDCDVQGLHFQSEVPAEVVVDGPVTGPYC